MRVLRSIFVVALLAAGGACAPDGGSDTVPTTTGGDSDDDTTTTTGGDGDGDTTTTTGGDGDGDTTTTGPDGPPPPPPPPAEVCDQIDIMFVIDDSGSMLQEQENLAANFPGFISVLDQFKTENGDPIDYRVAVTSTGIKKSIVPVIGFPYTLDGLDGEFVQNDSCGMTRRWVEKGDADPASQFACAARLGTNGSAYEMPLLAAKMAVDNPRNSGFFRPDALLGIVILTDEDDCSREDDNISEPFLPNGDTWMCGSVEPPSTYKAFLDKATGGEGRWAIATIAGPTDCDSEFGDAVAAVRLLEFVGLAGATGVFSSICEGDLTNALNDALMTFDTACQNLPRPD